MSKSFSPLYQSKYFSVIHATGSPDTVPSHFVARDYLESGALGRKGSQDDCPTRAVTEETAT